MRAELVKWDMKSLDEASEYFGIVSVSRTAKSIPMWSHYADHHRGIAIGLDLQNIGKAFGPFRNVKALPLDDGEMIKYYKLRTPSPGSISLQFHL